MKYKCVLHIEVTDDNSEANGGIFNEDDSEIDHIEPRDLASIAWHLSEAGARTLHRMLKESYYNETR